MALFSLWSSSFSQKVFSFRFLILHLTQFKENFSLNMNGREEPGVPSAWADFLLLIVHYPKHELVCISSTKIEFLLYGCIFSLKHYIFIISFLVLFLFHFLLFSSSSPPFFVPSTSLPPPLCLPLILCASYRHYCSTTLSATLHHTPLIIPPLVTLLHARCSLMGKLVWWWWQVWDLTRVTTNW